MLVIIAAAAVGLYWPLRVHQATRARVAYNEARSLWESDQITTGEICDAAVKLHRAQIAVPFADHHKAANDHFHRIEKVWNTAYGPFSEWRMGVATEQDFVEAKAKRDRVKAYYTDAARLAGIDLTGVEMYDPVP
jgi:hypothetical protein